MESQAPESASGGRGARSQEAAASLCPACGHGHLHRSHRRNLLETARSWFGSYPYRCAACQQRYFLDRGTAAQRAEAPPQPDKRPDARRRARHRLLRQTLLYALAVAAFLLFLSYIIREPAP